MALMTYEKLDVYRDAFKLAVSLHEASGVFPKNELYGGIADQMRRSSKSICANLAEGLSKQMSVADKKRFLQMALGSAEETRVWLSFAVDLKYMDAGTGDGYRESYATISKMLYKLQKSLTF